MTYTFAPSANVATLRESATIAVSARAKELRASGRPVIDLGAGEPDAPTPPFVCAAAAAAIDAGATKYTQVEGIAPLRAAIAADANARYAGPDRVTPAEVVVGAGTKQALFNACYTLFGAGDEVLIPTPAWTSYPAMISLARATPVVVPGARERDLKVDPRRLRDAATDRTRGLILNSPCNPTGVVYGAEELRAIIELATDRGWWVLSDEIYQRVAYDGPAPSALEVVAARDRLVIFNGVAKAYAMTGWRIGWAIAPVPLARAMAALQSHTTSNAAAVSQHAALVALTCRDEADRAVAAMVADLRARRDAVCALFRSAGVDFIMPGGALYVFIRVPSHVSTGGDRGSDFASRLLEERDVAVVPGAAFGAAEWIRLSFAAPFEDVLEGARRIVRALS
ncbi:MAG: pyridoxal phosphate-dependent aminotransferase [Gemmatimonadaceae bacterium]